ncbi:MAG: hypothetical protein ACRCWO_11065, partial [Bosea sp. (in: a-proteobacteria)]
SNQESRDAFVRRNDLLSISRESFGDFSVRNVSNILSNARTYWSGEEFNARLTTFARELTRLGLNVNFGSAALADQLVLARQSMPQAGPIETAQEVTSYFARTDLQRATTTFLAQGGADGPEVPILTAAETATIISSQGASAAWTRIFEEVSGGRVDLMQALGWVEAAGGGADSQTKSVAKFRDDLVALISAPIENAEYQALRDGTTMPAIFAAQRATRNTILETYNASGKTFNDLLNALSGRIASEPEFAEVVQAYLTMNGVVLPNGSSPNLFVPVLGAAGFSNMTRSQASQILAKLPSTTPSGGTLTNQYLPANFFTPNAFSTPNGSLVAEGMSQQDLLPGQTPEAPTVVPYDPGMLQPPPDDPNDPNPNPNPGPPPIYYWDEWYPGGPGGWATRDQNNTSS